jgi:hypothetical protein
MHSFRLMQQKKRRLSQCRSEGLRPNNETVRLFQVHVIRYGPLASIVGNTNDSSGESSFDDSLPATISQLRANQ